MVCIVCVFHFLLLEISDRNYQSPSPQPSPNPGQATNPPSRATCVLVSGSSDEEEKMSRLFVVFSVRQFRRQYSSRLSEIGRFQVPKTQGKYEGGQLFLHKIFGYRGVVLFPWVARVYDRDREAKDDEKNFEDNSGFNNIGKELKADLQTYYQTLIDTRDSPFIRTQPEIVTFLGQERDNSLYTIPGLDYVSHEDILPYIISDPFTKPINHELFDKFLSPEPGRVPPFTCKDSLQAWHEKNHRWLELTDVHRETTNQIRVTVMPFFMGAKTTQPSANYWWRYCIRLENLGPETVQLRERHWRIFSLSGTLETVRGRGVVGQEPVLSPQQPAFQYSSHVSLQAPSGHMWGTFRLERPDGSTFDIRIPPFSLESKEEETPPTNIIA
ncbi:polymerase delta-interacting protein 2 isoform X2 [Nematostella vectensis]|uniref:polymerase delta-interacting protein 2 isoform X2 n=1 Tax=Nematostella vectensis TaxID=45351 RepID=UPI0020778BE5|nr:polymerase delta-interacting protein 2 isoform X2 [Nematostella vectensis]